MRSGEDETGARELANLLAYDPALAGAGAASPRLLTLESIARALPRLLSPSLLANQAAAFRACSAGKVSILPIQTVGQPPMGPLLGGDKAQTCIKTGYIDGDEVFVAKVAGGGAEGHGNSGFLLIFSQRSLKLEKILFDQGILTEMRTAAATCLASSLLAPKAITRIGLIGVGVQAVWQLRFLRLVTDCRRAVVSSRSSASAERFKESMRSSACAIDREWEIDVAVRGEGASFETLFRECQLIHTLTTARTPVLHLQDLASCWSSGAGGRGRGLHISAVGADSPGKRELGPELVRAADLLVCDSLEQTFTRGEFQCLADCESPRRNQQTWTDRALPIEIGTVLNADALAKKLLRAADPEEEEDHRLTIFDTSGVAAQDISIAKMCCDFLTAKI